MIIDHIFKYVKQVKKKKNIKHRNVSGCHWLLYGALWKGSCLFSCHDVEVATPENNIDSVSQVMF